MPSMYIDQLSAIQPNLNYSKKKMPVQSYVENGVEKQRKENASKTEKRVPLRGISEEKEIQRKKAQGLTIQYILPRTAELWKFCPRKP